MMGPAGLHLDCSCAAVTEICTSQQTVVCALLPTQGCKDLVMLVTQSDGRTPSLRVIVCGLLHSSWELQYLELLATLE